MISETWLDEGTQLLGPCPGTDGHAHPRCGGTGKVPTAAGERVVELVRWVLQTEVERWLPPPTRGEFLP